MTYEFFFWQLAILIVGALFVSSLLRVLTSGRFVWQFVPRRYKKLSVFVLSFFVYACFLLHWKVLLVVLYSFISTFQSIYFYKQESKFRKHVSGLKKWKDKK